MPGHDIIVMGGSAGAVEAIRDIVVGLPKALPAAVFVVVHMSEDYPSILAQILNKHSEMPVVEAKDGASIEHGRIFVACPGRHLLVDKGHVRVVYGPRENGARPSVDTLFRTAANTYGPRVVGVVLSGTLDDGAAGMYSIKQRGGIAVVQDPRDALFPGMPSSVMANVSVDHVVPAAEIAPLLTRLASEPAPEESVLPMPQQLEVEADIALKGIGTMEDVDKIGRVTGLTCPECHGALWEVSEGKLVRFRCQTGHAFSIETLETEQGAGVEAALWAGIRALEEKAELIRRVAQRNRANKFEAVAEKYEQSAKAADKQAAALHKILADYGVGK